LRTLLVALLWVSPLVAHSAGPFTALHPEEAYPDPVGKPSQDAYSGFIRQVQEKLRELGFDAGPPNGDFGEKTQAALAQFQLSRTIPASGQLDDQTLAELGVARNAPQATADASSAGASADQPAAAGEATAPPSPAGSSERTAEPKPPAHNGNPEQRESGNGEKPGG
jgi:peptidoglycan hydrolase-like protein with peptidoglycan-binding domain